jgi:glycosyltransferase family protein
MEFTNRLIGKIRFNISKILTNIIFFSKRLRAILLGLNPKVNEVDNSVNDIINFKLSVSRFGDGEMRIIRGENIEFQKYSPLLGEKLKTILISKQKNIMVCLPDIFNSLHTYKKDIAFFWKKHLSKYYFSWIEYTDKHCLYGNSFISRPFFSYKDKSNTLRWFNNLKKIWVGRDIVIIEGEKSRLGLGNDLFKDADLVERILCPSLNAFESYREIRDTCMNLSKNKLLLIALGPTATVLAFDLNLKGYQAIDIGHIDIEYEWFLRGASKKIHIPDKHTNESPDQRDVREVVDPEYLAEVIAKIGTN